MNQIKTKILNYYKEYNKYIPYIGITMLICILMAFISRPEETKILNKLERYRTEMNMVDKDIVFLENALKEKIEKRNNIYKSMECQLNQLARLGNGEDVTDNYCENKQTSFINMIIPSANADDGQTYLRKERLKYCEQELYKLTGNKLPRDLILNKYEYEIYGQNAIVRCATYASLIYARESNFGTQCTDNGKNCYGNGLHNFATSEQYVEQFAKTYWNYNRQTFNSKTFVKIYMCGGNCKNTPDRVWDGSLKLSDQEVQERYNNYVGFIDNNYWNIYNELYSLYIK